MRHSNIRPLLLWCVAVVVVWPALAEQPVTGGAAEPDRDRITQVSVINALLLGQFDGRVPFAALLADGDFGLGTLDRLDGELVVVDGRGYQIKSDGEVVEVGPGAMIPFAVVTPFDRDGELPCPAVDSLAELERRLDGVNLSTDLGDELDRIERLRGGPADGK